MVTPFFFNLKQTILNLAVCSIIYFEIPSAPAPAALPDLGIGCVALPCMRSSQSEGFLGLPVMAALALKTQ